MPALSVVASQSTGSRFDKIRQSRIDLLERQYQFDTRQAGLYVLNPDEVSALIDDHIRQDKASFW